MPTKTGVNQASWFHYKRGTSIDKRFLHFLVYLAVCSWFIYLFRRYLPSLDSIAFQETFAGLGKLLRQWGIIDILFVGWIWITAYLLGKKLLEVLGISLHPGAERLWLCSTLGLSLLSLMTFLLGCIHLLRRAGAYALLVPPAIIWFGELRQLASKIRHLRARLTAPHPFSAQGLAHFFIITYIAIVLGIAFLSALGPEIEYDPLVMHLVAAKTFVRNHGLKAIPDIPQTFFPKNITMLFSLGMLLHTEITAKLVNYLLGLLACLGAYVFAVRYFSRSTGLVAVGILASSPLFVWEMRTAHLDCGFTLYVFLSLYATVLWLQDGQQKWFPLAVYSTAFSLGTKYQALFSLGSLATIVFFYRLMEHRNFYAAYTQVEKFFLLSIIGLLPWAIVNLVQTGNPIFPFLNEIFRSPYWSPEQNQTVLHQMTESSVQITLRNWWVVITSFWEMTVDQTNRFHGNIGPFYLMLIPLLVFQRRIHPTIKLILEFSFLYWVFWLFTGQHLRYYLGAIPGLAIVAANATVSCLETIRARTHTALAVGVATILAVIAVLNSPFFEHYGANARYGSPVIATLPLKYLLGQESRDEYLARNVKDYPVIQYANKLPGPKKVLFWWSDPAPGGYYLDGEVAFIWSRFAQELITDDSERILDVLRDNRVGYIVAGQPDQGRNLLTNPEGPFVQRYLKKLYQMNGFNLYQVSYVPLKQDVVSYDFLSHIDEASITMPIVNPPRPNTEYRYVANIGQVSRYALLSFPPSEAEFLLALPERPLLRFAIGRQFPPCNNQGSFQIWIVGADEKRRLVFREDVSAQNQLYDVGWFNEEFDLTTYAGQPVRVIFKTDSRGARSCNWFLWADPQIISRR